MGLNFSLDSFWGTGESSAGTNQFFSPMWSDRTENAYSDFFKHGGWEKPWNWVNPGGVMANPAQQLADPGDFFTAGEHDNWIRHGKVSDRTLASAAAAALAYGGGAALAGGAASGAGGGGAAAAGGEAGAATGASSAGGGVSGWFGNLFGGSGGGGAEAAATSGTNQGWWGGFTDWLGGGGTEGSIWSDQGALSSLLGGGGQSFSSSDPSSWQYQMGGQAQQMGQDQQAVEMMQALAANRNKTGTQTPDYRRRPLESQYSLLAGNGSIGLGTLSQPNYYSLMAGQNTGAFMPSQSAYTLLGSGGI